MGCKARHQTLKTSKGSDMTRPIIQKTRTFFDGPRLKKFFLAERKEKHAAQESRAGSMGPQEEKPSRKGGNTKTSQT